MIEQAKFIDMIRALDVCLTFMAEEAFHADQESLEEVTSLRLAVKDHKEELSLILQIDMSDKINGNSQVAINGGKPLVVGTSDLIAQIALDAYADAENTLQNVKTFMRKKI
jgi:hypothetical protein